MKVLITGARGQLGSSLLTCAPPEAIICACDRSRLDITDKQSVEALVRSEKPDIIINAAAYTAVDKAETDEEAASAVNATATGILADAARTGNARFVHVSTDFVFDGRSGTPYLPESPTNPLGVYGRTKLAGERLAGPDALIVRTAWVYAPKGGNFVRTMLRLMGERPEVRVVADQIGTPTYAPGLAAGLWALATKGVTGTLHYTDSGAASWYDFAVAIQEEAIAAGLLEVAVPIIPIRTVDYPTPAVRPSYSILDKTSMYEALGTVTPHWRSNLKLMMSEIRDNG
jgi:dTDP-4-dehydrorhamnose reductase